MQTKREKDRKGGYEGDRGTHLNKVCEPVEIA